MTRIRILLALPAALLALAGTAHALEVIYEDDPRIRIPAKAISEEQRKIDIQLGHCLQANGGRMAPRCAELRDQSARMDARNQAGAANAPPPATDSTSSSPTKQN